jgi:hypothetical protein
MRKIITAAVIVLMAAITTTWAISTPKSAVTNTVQTGIVGGGAPPMHLPPLW